jgi:hypothetical protein
MFCGDITLLPMNERLVSINNPYNREYNLLQKYIAYAPMVSKIASM